MAVLDAYAPIVQRFSDELAHLDLAVDMIPRMRLNPASTVLSDDIVADGPVPLGRLFAAGIDSAGRPTRARLVVFRQPVEARCENPEERATLLRHVLSVLVAQHLNLSPRDVDPYFED
ncbi:hypothetical protein CUTER_02505 [Corynebacterium uterequi]|uniref:Zinicin-like metallopeptidase n=2 Tax=Corynebacterium uterequi TaxID=1072256 RepID=A0A0G3HAX1_9CORY|nr:hypothetical protein CUTER_02505 [Corynebacterium uterequi]